MRQLRRIRQMLHCYFCGGRVIDTVRGTYRCETEGVTWDIAENLVLYSRPEGEELTQVRTQKDPVTGKFIPTG